MIFNKKNGFTFAEVALLLLLSTLLIMASMPIITKKHLAKDNITLHGKWACKLINGVPHQVVVPHKLHELPNDDNEWQEGCQFPLLPSSIKTIEVTVVGAGGNGNQSYSSIDTEPKTFNIFPQNDDKNSKDPDGYVETEKFIVPSSSTYNIRFEGARGEDGELSQQSMDFRFPNENSPNVYDTCSFPFAPANENVPYLSFKLFLNAGDKLEMKTLLNNDRKNTYNDTRDTLDHYFCDSKDTYIIESVSKYSGTLDYDGTELYHLYQSVERKYPDIKMDSSKGQNGYTREFYLNNKKIATIKGAGGGYWFSPSSDTCTQFCGGGSGIYKNTTDRVGWSIDQYIPYYDKSVITSEVNWGLAEPEGNNIKTNLPRLTIYAGCGGEAGEVKSTTIIKPDIDSLRHLTIKIGSAGEIYPEKRQTQFGSIIAHGAEWITSSCKHEGNNTYKGQNGGTSLDLKGSRGGLGGNGYENRDKLDGVIPTKIFDMFKKIDIYNTQENFDKNITDPFMNQIRGCMVDTNYYAQKSNLDFEISEGERPDYILPEYRKAAPWCGNSWARLYGEHATGIGNGGGGAGIAVAIPTNNETLADYLSSDFGIKKLETLIFKGTPGNGASGGIIVTW